MLYVCDDNDVRASREFRGHLKESAGTLSLLFVIFVAVFVVILYVF